MKTLRTRLKSRGPFFMSGRIEAAARANALQAEMGQMALRREEAILDACILAYRSGRLEPLSALTSIAEIAALRRLEQDMRDEYRKAIEESMEEEQNASNN